MYTRLTIIVSLAAVLFMVLLMVAMETDAHSFQFFMFWTGAPYLGHCGLVLSRRARGFGCPIFVCTLLSAGLASLAYAGDSIPFIVAKSRGQEIMSCSGPLIELGVPLLQWCFFLGILLVTRFSSTEETTRGVGTKQTKPADPMDEGIREV